MLVRSQQQNKKKLLATTMFTRAILISLLLFVPAGATVQAQLFTGSINGVVRDPTQSAIPGATVTVRNTATSDTRTGLTSAEGLYSISPLNPGDYEVTVSHEGFRTYEHGSISLDSSQTLQLNVELTVGSVTQQVSVTGAVSLLNTEDANRSVTFSATELQALPNNTHSSLGSAWATGGVISVHTGMNGLSPTSGDQNMDRFALNGGRDMASAMLIDGISVTAGDWGGSIGLPSSEMVRETQVFRNTYDTQYGKTDGGVVSLTTRSGSAALHGSAYEYWQGDSLNANTWTNDHNGLPKTPYTQNLFGGHLGGPIWRSRRLFYFGNYEGTRQSAPGTLTTTVPTAAERMGDFSQATNTSGTLSTIYNPFTATLNSNGSYTRQAFAGNVIPAALINPTGQTIANLFPLPNRNSALNYAATGNGSTTLDRMDLRSDWVVNSGISIFGTFFKLWNTATAPIFIGHGLDNNYVGLNPMYRGLVSGTWVPSSSFVLNVTGALSTWRQLQISPSTTAGVTGSVYGFSNSLVSDFPTNTTPAITFENYLTLGNARKLIYILHNNDLQVNATKTRNRHVFKFGYQMTVQLMNDYDQSSGSFAFNRGMTSGATASTDSSTTGDAIASLLLGTLASGSVVNAVAPASAQKYLSWYGEDAWRLTDRLTFNYGLRYEIQFGRTERHNRYNYFDPNAVSPLAASTGLPIKGGLVYDSGSHRGLWNTPYNNFAPRVALAYKASNDFVVRAGYGIFYVQTISAGPTGNTDGFSVTTPIVASQNNAGLVPQNPINNPFPTGLLQPIGSSQGLLTEVGNGVNAFLLKHPTPYVQSFSADFQYQPTANTVLQVGYQGSQGRKLAIGYGLNKNQLDPQYLSLGNALTSTVANPFYGIFPAGGQLSGTTLSRNQLLRPYPQFTSVSVSADTPGASSSYNALLVNYSQHVRHDLTAVINYQWSKAIDNTSETGFNSDAARNVYNLSLERSISAHNVPQNFTATVIWQLPFGRGKQFGSQMNRLADAFLGNWQFSTITNFVSGQPLQFSCPNTLSSFGFSVCRPNISNVPALALSQRKLTQWFNTSTSVVSAPAAFTIGNAPRYLNNVRTGKLERSDVTVRKNFVVTGEKTIGVQATAYNIANTPYYGAANTTLGSPTYGQVTGTAAGAFSRTVELGARFTF
jgi:Carboxypeptidase regulatory-like domain